MRILRIISTIINTLAIIGIIPSSCSNGRSASENSLVIVPDTSSMFQYPTDSAIRVLALGENVTPALADFVRPMLENSVTDKSFIRYLPLLFFISFQYDNVVHRSPFYCENLNNWIADLSIYNLKALENLFRTDEASMLLKRVEDAYRKQIPEYIYQQNYPDTLLFYRPLMVKETITENEYLRYKALNGDKEALKELEQQFKATDMIAELAYYYYFIAFTHNEPDYLYNASLCLYEASKSHQYCLSGAMNILMTGEKIGNKKCSEALSGIQGVTDSIVQRFSP